MGVYDARLNLDAGLLRLLTSLLLELLLAAVGVGAAVGVLLHAASQSRDSEMPARIHS